MRLRTGQKQRGVLLLVVMTTLVLFVLIAIAFVLNAGQQHSAAKSASRLDITGNLPRRHLDLALLQLLRGSANTESVIRGHSLLRDMYGSDGFSGTVTSATLATGSNNQFFDVILNTTASKTTDGITYSAYTLSPSDDYYNGCVFTLLTKPGRGISVHIADYKASSKTIRIPRFSTRSGRLAQALDFASAKFVINGRPFNGTGFGYDSTTGKLDLRGIVGGKNRHQALMPRSVESEASGGLLLKLQGGADESWDAPDNQNLALAYIADNASHGGMIIPSFHRPALIRYYNNRLLSFTNPEEQRVSFRPGLKDTKKFVRLSSPYTGPWDVDNDGDGIPDSVWVDLGFPNQTGPNGGVKRPLVAFLCIDMDGKLNVNAHGNQTHLASLDPKEKPIPEYLAGTAAVNSNTLPPGQGYGPAEINLGRLFSPTIYERLMQGGADVTTGFPLPGRYGLPGESTALFPTSTITAPASPTTGPVPGFSGIDYLAGSQLFGFPPNYFLSGNAGVWGSYSSQPDLRGQFSVGVRYRGQPVYERSYVTDLRRNNPYELNLSRNATRGLAGTGAPDLPFSAGELERVLRAYDGDATSLPDRMWRLLNLGADSNFHQNRRRITTDSFDLPSPNITSPLASRVANGLPLNIIDLLRQRMPSLTATQISQLLSVDLRNGLRMDVNRPFGNGTDNDNDGVVDDSGIVGYAGEDSDQLTYPQPTSAETVNFNYINGNSGVGTSLQARQLYARHLYVLMMLLTDPTTKTADQARDLAQWAINVVDFRDADSIMTQFRYDPNPFDGWNATETVWGCERPELLLTETLTFHDRRTEDLAFTSGGVDNKETTDATDPDTHFDQEQRPRGSFFFELYNPWTQGDPIPTGLSAIAGDPKSNDTRPQDRNPAEFYGTTGAGVLLNKVTPNGNDPVWRVVVVKGAQGQLDPDDPDSSQRPTIDRSFYFTNLATISKTGGIGVDGETYYSSVAAQAPLLPGRYAVIGSSGTETSGTYTTYVGERTDGDKTKTRRLVMTPNTNTATNQFVVNDNTETPATPTHDPVVVIPINEPRSGSITEPVSGYTDTGWNSTTQKYDPPLDVPLDTGLLGGDGDPADYKDYATVHLQRLANPLLPYHATNNPYLTIDSMSSNLTVFNGSESTADPNLMGKTGSGTGNFVTFERGYLNNGNGGLNGVNLWSHEPAYTTAKPNPDPAVTSTAGGGTHNFDEHLQHTLGHLNRHYAFNAGVHPARGWNDARDPGRPFPWLAWFNRPFATHLELMQVPRSRSSRLLFDFTMLNSSSSNPYTSTTPPFGHLLNFFGRSATSSHAYRLFEYVHVPSRFVGTDTVLDPSTFAATNAGTTDYHPPFNRLSRYRDPGKININTISSQVVWEAFLNGHPGPTWDQLVESRRGYGSGNDPFLFTAKFPSFFSSPFRAFGTGKLAPLVYLEEEDIETTFLRSNQAGTSPLFPPPSIQPHNDPTRNSYSRYQGIQRIGNLLTTRSNVYAVWITIGYFDVHSANGHLAKEHGSDTGNAIRHRGFYLVDRSVPVAFEPGKNHNVEDAVLIRRVIE